MVILNSNGSPRVAVFQGISFNYMLYACHCNSSAFCVHFVWDIVVDSSIFCLSVIIPSFFFNITLGVFLSIDSFGVFYEVKL